jgi:uncharacterized Fe-S center protein
MLNKEGILFTTVITFFMILFVTQLVAIGYLMIEKKKKKVSIKIKYDENNTNKSINSSFYARILRKLRKQ